MKKNVLLVEDDPALRMVMREVLKNDFDVAEADNGDDGINMGLNQRADLIILDYHLPKRDGLEVIAAVKQAYPDLPVIVLTGYLNPESEEQFNRLGANKIFPKPFNYKNLLETVRSLSEESVSLTPKVPMPYQAPEAGAAPAEENAILQDSLNTVASLAEKIEFLQTISEKYWIEPSDIVTIRETARCMTSELRKFYGKLNDSVFDSANTHAPILRKAAKPCLSGEN